MSSRLCYSVVRFASRRLLATFGHKKYASPYDIAGIYRRLGDVEQVLAWIERGIRERDGGMIDVRRTDEPWRSNARFQALLRRIGLPQ